MTAPSATREALAEVEAMGGRLRLVDGQIKAAFPSTKMVRFAPLLERLRANREAVIALLSQKSDLVSRICYVHGTDTTWWQRQTGGWICGLCHPSFLEPETQANNPPAMPRRVRLLQWELKEPPIVLTRYSIVVDPAKFARKTIEELHAALDGKNWLAGNWSVRDLVDRLEQIGVIVEIE
jgi:hypothetical protein